MNAEIIAVGTEILLGQILNTNAKYISECLAGAGVNMYYQTVIGDNPERLKKALETAFSRVDTVILTGGLGPTCDDLTKETVAEYFGKKLARDAYSLEKIEKRMTRLGAQMTENNKKQADMPEGCIILENLNGTAPGCIVEENGKTAIMLPGPPSEMEPMFKDAVMPYLMKKTNSVIHSVSVRIFGKGESLVETLLRDLMDRPNPSLAPYAKEGEVELRVTARAENEDEAIKLAQPVVEEIKNRLGENIYGYDDDTLETVAVKKLIAAGKTVSTAESCTGGMVASAITAVAGSSEVFGYGFVTYANEAKENLVGVEGGTLKTYGAVSSQTAMEMAKGAREKSGSDIGVSTTGIAGPGGGTDEKPVGLVYIAISTKEKTEYKKLNLLGDRNKIRRLTVKHVMNMIIENL